MSVNEKTFDDYLKKARAYNEEFPPANEEGGEFGSDVKNEDYFQIAIDKFTMSLRGSDKSPDAIAGDILKFLNSVFSDQSLASLQPQSILRELKMKLQDKDTFDSVKTKKKKEKEKPVEEVIKPVKKKSPKSDPVEEFNV